MRINKTMSRLVVGLIGSTLLLGGCSGNIAHVFGKKEPEVKTVYKKVLVEVPSQVPPGTVEYVWEEPMVDIVDVPPGLDPEGHYYRPAHKAVVEVRQGRWRHYSPKESR